MLKIAWYSTYAAFWICWFQWHRFWSCTFRHFWVMGYMYALSWKLLIIDLLLVYYATLFKRLYLKKIAAKCSIFLHQLDFFLMWRSRMLFVLFGYRIKHHLGRAKGRGNGGMRETPNQGFFLQNSHYKVRYKLYLTNCWSDKLLTTTTVISTSKKLNVQTFKWFWAVLPGQKQLCFCTVKEKYGFQIGNAMDKNKLHFDHGEMLKIAWYSTHVGFWICWFQWHRFWSCTSRHFWVMGLYVCIILVTTHHRLTFGIFATLLKRLHLKKLAAKCSIFLHQLDFFLMWRSRMLFVLFGYGSNFIWGGQKEE